MTTLTPTLRRTVDAHRTLVKVLLGCGVVGPVWWVAMDVLGSVRYPGYSYVDQTISELSALGAPTRAFMTVFSAIPYSLLLITFGIGIWIAARESRAGRVASAAVVAEALWGVAGGLAFPMATREVMAAHQETLRNQMHQWYGIGMPILFVLAVGFGSTLLGKWFRYYSYATIFAVLVSGFMMAPQVSSMAANEPTPWMGVEERITGYLPMLWYVVLAIGLLRARGATALRHSAKPTLRPRTMQQVP